MKLQHYDMIPSDYVSIDRLPLNQTSFTTRYHLNSLVMISFFIFVLFELLNYVGARRNVLSVSKV